MSSQSGTLMMVLNYACFEYLEMWSPANTAKSVLVVLFYQIKIGKGFFHYTKLHKCSYAHPQSQADFCSWTSGNVQINTSTQIVPMNSFVFIETHPLYVQYFLYIADGLLDIINNA